MLRESGASCYHSSTVSSSIRMELVHCKGTTEANKSFARRSFFVDAIWPDGDLLMLSCSARYPYPCETCMHGVVGGCLLFERRTKRLFALGAC